ncbi:MAG: hypothetical protein ACKOYC_05950 [Bacteroidota bacterium]
MTKDRLAKLLKSPVTRDEEAISGLEEIVSRYPYYTNGHILLTIQYKLIDHIRYEHQLRRASVHVPNRAILRKLVLSPKEIPLPGEVFAEANPIDANVSTETVVEKPAARLEVVKEEQADISKEIHETPSPAPVSKERKDPRKVIEERLRELKEQERAIREQLDLEIGEVEPLATDSATGNQAKEPDTIDTPESIVSPSEKTVVDKKVVDEPVGESQIAEPVVEQPKLGETSFKKPEPSESIEAPETKAPFNKEEKHTFADWLKNSQTQTAEINKKDERTYAKPYHLDEDGAGPKPQKEVAASDSMESDLIERFIREEPRIVPAKSEFYSPGNMARKSAQEHEDLISETLARIYAQQGRFDKAIVTYERLSLKLPEKKAYFASLIENLKSKNL